MVNFNVSQPLVDPLEDTDNLLRNYEEETLHVVFDYFRTVTDCIKLFICTCVIAINIFLIYVFCKFKNLKCKANRYILHYAICNILYLTTPVLYIAIDAIDIVSHNSTTLLCIIIQIESTCLTMCFLLAFGLGVDWVITTFLGELKNVGERVYRYFIPILYLIGFIKLLAQSTFCFIDMDSIRHIFSVVVYALVLIFTLMLDYLSCSDKYKPPLERKQTYSLTIANIIILSWLSMFIYHALMRLALGNENFELVLWYTMFVPEWIAYGSSLSIFIALIKLNKTIREDCYKVFRRSSRNYDKQDDLGYSDVDLEDDVFSSKIYI